MFVKIERQLHVSNPVVREPILIRASEAQALLGCSDKHQFLRVRRALGIKEVASGRYNYRGIQNAVARRELSQG